MLNQNAEVIDNC